MKNIVIIDIDTERNSENEQMILIGKPEEFPEPTNREEALKMINEDILTICEGLISVINTASANGYISAETALNQCISHLNDSVKK